MPRSQGKKNKNTNSRIDSYFKKEQQKEQFVFTSEIIGNKKKPICALKSFPQKDNSLKNPEVAEATLRLKHLELHFLVKQIQFKTLFKRCGNLSAFCSMLQSFGIETDIIQFVLDKYIHGHTRSLWGDKYQPKLIPQLKCLETAEKIKMWIKSFFFYRNKVQERQNTFINDYSQEAFSCSLHEQANENGWKLKALIVRGKEAIGKRTLIHAVCRSIDCQLYQCASDSAPIKYLSEKHQSTKSESLKNVICKKRKPEAGSKAIDSYFPAQKGREKSLENQANKVQLVINYPDICPQKSSFQAFLLKIIEPSLIPFILTMRQTDVPEKLSKFDVIEVGYPTQEKIIQVIWTIFHVERNLRLCSTTQLTKQNFEEYINKIFSIQAHSFIQFCTLQDTQTLCRLLQFNFNKIYTLIQFFSDFKDALKVAEKMEREHLNQLTGNSLLHENLNLHFLKSYGTSNEKECSQTQSTEIDIIKQEQSTKQPNQLQKIKCLKQQFYLRASEDYIRRFQQKNQYYLFEAKTTNPAHPIHEHDLQYSDLGQVPLYYEISTTAHRQAQQKAVKSIRKAVSQYLEEMGPLKRVQLSCFPMLFVQKRSNRKNKFSATESLGKLCPEPEAHYILSNMQVLEIP